MIDAGTSDPLTPPALAARTRWDLVVVGAGTAGLVAATTATLVGARVVLVDRSDPGGDCLWTGCVPSKTLLASAQRAADARSAGAYGVHVGSVDVDFPAVMARVHAVIAAIEPDDEPATLVAAGVTVVRATARFTGPGTLDVDGETLRFDRAMIAAGATPTLPDLPGLADAQPLTTQTLWDLTELPERLVVIGGGPVGVEMSQAFARLGADVVLVHHGEALLPRDDPDAAEVVRAALVADGVEVRLGARVQGVAGRSGEAVEVDLGGDAVTGTHLLVALGRTPATADLGLETLGVALDADGAVVVDATGRTTSSRVWAAGDVTGSPYFTHAAGLDASTAGTNAVLGLMIAASTVVPHVTFTDPEVGAVGLATWGPMPRGHSVQTVHHHDVDRAVTAGETAGFSRLRLDRRGVVVGATVISPRAGETLGELTVAVDRGLTAGRLGSVQHAYPTFSDGAWDAAIADRRERVSTPAARAVLSALLRARRWRDRR